MGVRPTVVVPMAGTTGHEFRSPGPARVPGSSHRRKTIVGLSSAGRTGCRTADRVSSQLANVSPPPTVRPQAVLSVERASSLHRQGKLPEAEALYQAILKADRGQFDALHGLGLLRSQQRRWEEARSLFRRALRRNPQSAEAEYNLGIALGALKRPDDAALHFQRAVALRPDFFQAHNNLGNTLKALGRSEAAIEQYRRALAVNPEFAIGHNNLGNSLQAAGRREEAETHYRRAIALQPGYADAHNNLGSVLRLVGRPEAAVACYEQALSLEPGYVEAQNNLGNTLKELGRFDEAAAALRKTIALDPKHTGALLDLTEVRKIGPEDPELAMMERLAADKGALADNARAPLHFALAKIYADLDRHDDAFAQMLAGNALKRRELRYDEAATLDQFRRIEQIFTPEFLRENAGSGDPSPAPIFIVGMPRSGTTLVEQILASHPRVFGAGELDEISKLAQALPYPQGILSVGAAELGEFGRRYATGLRARGGDADRISDKMPANFLYIGLIRLILPNARIIHTRRNPVDTCLSCYSKLFTGPRQAFSYDLGELGRYWRHYDALMAHWRRILPADAMFEIRYADLVTDLETEARRLIDYCGLEWADACLAFHRTERPVLTASVAQVRQPIYQSAVGRWHVYERHLAPLLAELPADRLLE
jgi:tetratricopeptide (TPR) repeat protein